jgi:hypothetical protein
MKPLRKVDISWSSDFAYAVGFIASDGNLSSDRRHINLTSKDEEIIKIFKRCLSLTNNVGLKGRGGNPLKIYYFLQFGDRIFYDFLLSIGLMPAKSKVLGEIKIPKEYFADFFERLYRWRWQYRILLSSGESLAAAKNQVVFGKSCISNLD